MVFQIKHVTMTGNPQSTIGNYLGSIMILRLFGTIWVLEDGLHRRTGLRRLPIPPWQGRVCQHSKSVLELQTISMSAL